MSVRKFLKVDEKGFIFTLDATLALLVILLALVGVAGVGTSSTSQSQFGHLQLLRQADDALQVMRIAGVNDNIQDFLSYGLIDENSIESQVQTELNKILSSELQYRFQVGGDENKKLEVYRDESGGETAFNSAEEVVSSTRTIFITSENRFEPMTLYVWRRSEP